MKNYIYYVSYAHGSNGTFGFGAFELYRSEPIKSFDDIVSIQEKLKSQDKDIKNPLIIDFILLRTDE